MVNSDRLLAGRQRLLIESNIHFLCQGLSLFMPLMSSSFDTEAVRARRREDWTRRLRATGTLDAATLYSFHESHGPQPSAYSPCMHRPDAETVSFSWVCVTDSAVEFFYTPAARPVNGRPDSVKRLSGN